jgi:hypothetical protein
VMDSKERTLRNNLSRAVHGSPAIAPAGTARKVHHA